jgi:hypothetical protein
MKQLRREFEKFSCRKLLAQSSKSEDARKRLPYHNIQTCTFVLGRTAWDRSAPCLIGSIAGGRGILNVEEAFP